jgi:hypothetical protein
MLSMFSSKRILTGIAAVGAFAAAGAGTAVAAGQGVDTQISISSRTTVASAGQKSPVDVGGVRAVRAGRDVPAGYVLIGRQVKITRGTQAAYGALTMRCPAGKTLRGLARQGKVGLNVMGLGHYDHKRFVNVLVTFDANNTPAGQTVEGAILAVCR